ncbi:MAG: EAL domain-containing protein [Gammaproteobacteria bacterium]
MGAKPDIHFSACPHDCPSTCALEIERLDPYHIGKVRGAADNSYTAGVICSKVARYAERIHHPDRLLTPLRRRGAKSAGDYVPIHWDDALDEVAEAFLQAEQRFGAETVWPYYYAGTMGLVMRDGINRLRHAKRYSGQYSTICTTLAWTGFLAATGKLAGVDPREMSQSDVVVIWGTNAASTQVNVMTHALRARRERGAQLVVVDTYRNATAEQADLFVCVRPGTDGALACAVLHCLFRHGYANWDYLERYTDCPRELESHLETRTPAWASAISGVPVATIEAFARLIGEHPRTFFRLGYGFSRSRNGAINMHAAACIPAVTGAWLHEGGGAFHSNGAIFHWDRTLIEGNDVRDPNIRLLDQSRIGAVLTHEPRALQGGPPVTAMLIQNTNPMAVAPDLNTVHRGFGRSDLFVCVHEQFMTETAAIADIVQAKRFISALNARGCRFALDDFGSGFSSFTYLKNLPVDFLKIDGSFVREIANDSIDLAMVRSINEIGHVMGKRTIAEFVEDRTILDVLRDLGVDYAQGYEIGRPQPIADFKPD